MINEEWKLILLPMGPTSQTLFITHFIVLIIWVKPHIYLSLISCFNFHEHQSCRDIDEIDVKLEKHFFLDFFVNLVRRGPLGVCNKIMKAVVIG